MSIRTLKTFLAVAKHGTFAAAAKEIGLTQAAVSMQMKALESELDTVLFDRVGRTVVLNTSGRNLVPTAKQIVGLYQDMSLAVNSNELGGSLYIGAVPPTFARLLPEALLQLKRDYPRLNVHVVSGVSDDLAAKVERGELDAAIVADPPEPLAKSLTMRAIVREPLVFIVPKTVRMKKARDTLAEQPFIRLARQSWTGRFIDQALRQRGIEVQTVMELDMPDGIVEMVARGFGVSIIPMYDGRWLDDPRLNVWRFTKPRLERGLSVLERQAHTRTALTRALVQRLLDTQKNNRRSVSLETTSLDG